MVSMVRHPPYNVSTFSSKSFKTHRFFHQSWNSEKVKKNRICSNNLDQIKTKGIYLFFKIVQNRWVSPLFLKSPKKKSRIFFSWPKFYRNSPTDWFRQYSSNDPPILLQCSSNAPPMHIQCLFNTPPVLLRCSSRAPPMHIQ